VLVVLHEVRIAIGIARVPAVLASDWNDHLVDERVAKTRDLRPSAGGGALAIVSLDPATLTARRRPDADHGLLALDVGRDGTVASEVGLQYLNRDRADGVALGSIFAAHRGQLAQGEL